MTDMPKIVAELATMINRMPASPHWKRLVICVTRDEWHEIRDFYFQDTGGKYALMSIRGVPLVIVEDPLNQPVRIEYT